MAEIVKVKIKKRKRPKHSLAVCGRIGLYLGSVVRRQADLICEQNGLTYAHLGRIAFQLLIDYYLAHGKLPKTIFQDNIGRPGRRRKFQRYEQ